MEQGQARRSEKTFHGVEVDDDALEIAEQTEV
jgi:hypothetical protein